MLLGCRKSSLQRDVFYVKGLQNKYYSDMENNTQYNGSKGRTIERAKGDKYSSEQQLKNNRRNLQSPGKEIGI